MSTSRVLRLARPALAAWALCAASVGAFAADLTVSAAASLTNAFNEIGPAFEAANPGAKVQFNYAASGALLQQIAKGAPVDVFASADQETMNQAEQQQLVKPGTRANFVSNSLVVIVPQDAASVPKTLADLNAPAIKKVAIGVPASVPVGRYTKAVLEKANLWPQIEAKMIGAQSVRQALDYVARGEVDAGFVYGTDAAVMPDKVKVAFTVPTDTPVLYPIAPIAASNNAAMARKFVAYVTSPASSVCSREVRIRQALVRRGGRLGRARTVPEGRPVGDRARRRPGRDGRLRAGAVQVSGPGAARFHPAAADGPAADRSRLLPAGGHRPTRLARRLARAQLRDQPDLHLAGRRDRGGDRRLSVRLQVGARRLRERRGAVRAGRARSSGSARRRSSFASRCRWRGAASWPACCSRSRGRSASSARR